jgi:hypothetical protein
VVLEATWGWYWAADVITEAGGRVHLAHPLGIAGFENRRVKNDRVDARLLADLLRMGRLPESWIPPEGVRHQRELVRYRRKLSQLRAGLKAQVHVVLGKEGLLPPINRRGVPRSSPMSTRDRWLHLSEDFTNRLALPGLGSSRWFRRVTGTDVKREKGEQRRLNSRLTERRQLPREEPNETS